MTTLFIKNMVCNRCIMVVQNELDKFDLEVKNIRLGEVILDKEPTTEEKDKLDGTPVVPLLLLLSKLTPESIRRCTNASRCVSLNCVSKIAMASGT